MSRAVAIRSITTHGKGSVEISYSVGATAQSVPAAISGSYVWSSPAALQKAIKLFDSTLNDQQLVLLHLCITWLQQNGALGDIVSVTNKTLVLDTTAVQPLKIV